MRATLLAFCLLVLATQGLAVQAQNSAPAPHSRHIHALGKLENIAPDTWVLTDGVGTRFVFQGQVPGHEQEIANRVYVLDGEMVGAVVESWGMHLSALPKLAPAVIAAFQRNTQPLREAWQLRRDLLSKISFMSVLKSTVQQPRRALSLATPQWTFSARGYLVREDRDGRQVDVLKTTTGEEYLLDRPVEAEFVPYLNQTGNIGVYSLGQIVLATVNLKTIQATEQMTVQAFSANDLARLKALDPTLGEVCAKALEVEPATQVAAAIDSAPPAPPAEAPVVSEQTPPPAAVAEPETHQ
jgi:hypothetical protein